MMELRVDNAAGVQAHLRKLGWLDSSEHLLDLSVAGVGNMNYTLRARSETRTFILKQAVPYVARYPQIAAPIERLDVEAAFYDSITVSPTLSRHTPRIYGYDPLAHLLCLEDLGEAGDYTALYPHQEPHQEPQQEPHQTPGTPIDVALPLTELGGWLGALHSIPVGEGLMCRFANRAMRALNHAHIFEIPLQTENGVDPLAGTAELAAAFAADRQLKQSAGQLGALYMQAATNPDHPVLLHGDFYPGAWLKGRQPDEVYIIDPEFAFIGPAEFDLGVWFAHLTFLGMDNSARNAALAAYPRRALVDETLIRRFAGMEIIRRLLGVARLPLQVHGTRYCQWLLEAREEVCA